MESHTSIPLRRGSIVAIDCCSVVFFGLFSSRHILKRCPPCVVLLVLISLHRTQDRLINRHTTEAMAHHNRTLNDAQQILATHRHSRTSRFLSRSMLTAVQPILSPCSNRIKPNTSNRTVRTLATRMRAPCKLNRPACITRRMPALRRAMSIQR